MFLSLTSHNSQNKFYFFFKMRWQRQFVQHPNIPFVTTHNQNTNSLSKTSNFTEVMKLKQDSSFTPQILLNPNPTNKFDQLRTTDLGILKMLHMGGPHEGNSQTKFWYSSIFFYCFLVRGMSKKLHECKSNMDVT